MSVQTPVLIYTQRTCAKHSCLFQQHTSITYTYIHTYINTHYTTDISLKSKHQLVCVQWTIRSDTLYRGGGGGTEVGRPRGERKKIRLLKITEISLSFLSVLVKPKWGRPLQICSHLSFCYFDTTVYNHVVFFAFVHKSNYVGILRNMHFLLH